jgi:type II secretory pathway component PulF
LLEGIIIILGVLTLLRYVLPEIRKVIEQATLLLPSLKKFLLGLRETIRDVFKKSNYRL